MAFTFNWTQPSSDFYSNAREVLTTALNSRTSTKSTLSSDVEVEDLWMGEKPPDIEVLEIADGDGAGEGFDGHECWDQEKFRGVFRIRYDGDGWIRLKTKVQINPLHTSLTSTPSFTSPSPLFASTPLTLPLTITLSHIRLDGFVILVFSRSKGVTLVFRNDPLESLTVESTFNHIPFIRDYLQTEIESSIRLLFVEELPVAVYRLSLRLLNPDLQLGAPEATPGPRLASPPTDTLNSSSDDEDEPFWNPDNNILSLNILLNSQHTLSLFTPTIKHCLIRAHLPTTSPAPRRPARPSTPLSAPATPGEDTPSHPSSPVRRRKRRVINLRPEHLDAKTASVETASAPETHLPPVLEHRSSSSEHLNPPQAPRLQRPRLLRQSAGESEKCFLRRVWRDRTPESRPPSYRTEK